MEAERAWAMAKTALEELGEHLRTIGPPRGMGWGDMCVIQRSRETSLSRTCTMRKDGGSSEAGRWHEYSGV